MIKIIGFGEVVLLNGNMTAKKEMRVSTPDGREHGVEVPESVVSQLLKLWVEYKGAPAPVPTLSPAPPAPAPVVTVRTEEPTPDLGEVTFGGDLPAVEKPVVNRPAVPGFMAGGDDDDGAQI